MMEPETHQVGDFLLRKELLDRRQLHGYKIKPSGNLLYEAVWAVRRAADGPESRPVHYFLRLQDARTWAEAGGQEPAES